MMIELAILTTMTSLPLQTMLLSVVDDADDMTRALSHHYGDDDDCDSLSAMMSTTTEEEEKSSDDGNYFLFDCCYCKSCKCDSNG
jgi:hypothetical protein